MKETGEPAFPSDIEDLDLTPEDFHNGIPTEKALAKYGEYMPQWCLE